MQKVQHWKMICNWCIWINRHFSFHLSRYSEKVNELLIGHCYYVLNVWFFFLGRIGSESFLIKNFPGYEYRKVLYLNCMLLFIVLTYGIICSTGMVRIYRTTRWKIEMPPVVLLWTFPATDSNCKNNPVHHTVKRKTSNMRRLWLPNMQKW